MADFNLLGGPVSQSQTALFQDFLTRANRYPALQLFGSAVSSQKVCLVEVIINIIKIRIKGILQKWFLLTKPLQVGKTNIFWLMIKTVQVQRRTISGSI